MEEEGEDVRAVELVRRRKRPLDGRTPGADMYLGSCQGRKMEKTCTRDGSHRLAWKIPCGLSAREEISDKRWRPVGGGTVLVDGCSAPRRVGGENRVQRYIESALTGGRQGSDRS